MNLYERSEVKIVQPKGKTEDLSLRQFEGGKVLGFAGDKGWWVECECNNIFKRDRYDILKIGCICRKCKMKIVNTREHDRTVKIGDKFGLLEVIEVNKNRITCRCDCGNVLIREKYSLFKSGTKNCGCLKLNKLNEMVGKKFGRLLVMSYTRGDGEKSYYLCRCDCGNELELPGCALRSGNTRSCSCLFREKASETAKRTSKNRSRYGGIFVENELAIPKTCPENIEDLTNREIGEGGTVIGYWDKIKEKHYWLCKCECGKYFLSKKDAITRDNPIKGCWDCRGDRLKRKLEKTIIGNKFDYLTVVGIVKNNGLTNSVYCCVCDCGNFCTRKYYTLTDFNISSCGCYVTNLQHNRVNLVGQKFGIISVLKYIGIKNGRKMYYCQCECGKYCIKYNATLYKYKSCGCYNSLLTSQRNKGKNYCLGFYHKETKKERMGWSTSHLNRLTFKRDNYTCFKCGKRGRKLRCHHVRNWKDHEEFRFSINNLCTLCDECHKQFHKEYGKRYTSVAQLEWWTKKEFNPKLMNLDYEMVDGYPRFFEVVSEHLY